MLRLLAVTTAQRWPGCPETPTISEAGVPGYDFTSWMGVLAPVETARVVVTRVHRDISRIAHLPEVKSRFAASTADPVGSSSEEFGAYLRSRIARWSKVVKAPDFARTETHYSSPGGDSTGGIYPAKIERASPRRV